MAVVLQYTSKGSEEWAKEVVKLAKSNLIRGKKNRPGTLMNSISYTIDPRTLQIDFYYEDYGENVESGRKPNSKFPPPPAIAAWAKQRGIPQFRDKKGRYISNDSRTFLLSRAIAIKGIRPFPFFIDAIEDSISKLYSRLEDGIARDIEDSIEI
jgi:hypothetical protein